MEGVFCSGDLVFAKIRGYPSWPARIEGPVGKYKDHVKYSVIFFSSSLRGVCSENHLYHYASNKQIFARQCKSKSFQKALKEIEEAALYQSDSHHESDATTLVKQEKTEAPYSEAHIKPTREVASSQELSLLQNIKKEELETEEELQIDTDCLGGQSMIIVKAEQQGSEEAFLAPQHVEEADTYKDDLVSCEEEVKVENLLIHEWVTEGILDELPQDDANEEINSQVKAALRILQETSYLSDLECDDTSPPNIKEEQTVYTSRKEATVVNMQAASQHSACITPVHQSRARKRGQITNRKKELSCLQCGKTFSCLARLRIHKRSHTGERPFKCNKCGKGYADKAELARHNRHYSNDCTYTCHECGRSFVRKYRFQDHLLCHSDISGFDCEVCGKGFKTYQQLCEHLRIHKASYECDVCKKVFNLKSTLVTHMRIHTGDRPFVCKTCGKRFYHKSHMNRHMGIHSREALFNCNSCGKCFNVKESLKCHLKKSNCQKSSC